jgi:transcriptional regulator with XRE-family HTH domain
LPVDNIRSWFRLGTGAGGVAVTDVGSELGRARERLVLSITELAYRTKISEATLLAIERNDLNALPGGIYLRGFLRAYAREVGCDPEEIVARYRTQSNEEAESNRLHGQSTPNLTVRCDSGQVHSATVDAMDRRDARAKLIGTLVVLLVGGFLYFLLDRSMHTTKPSPDLLTVDAPQLRPAVETATIVAVGTGGPSPGTASIDEQLNALRLDIQARALCWLSGTADGRRVIYRLLNAGERIQIEATDLVLRIGDAANLEFTINGVAGRPLGPAGQAVTIHLTPQNYQEFLSH